MPPPRDPALVRGDAPGPADGAPPSAVYNHRLYAHYGSEEFLRLAVELASPALRLTVMDLFGNRRAGRTALDASPERFRDALAALPGVEVASDGGDRGRYRQVLAAAHIGIAPYRPSCPWSLSVIDCQAMGLPVISPPPGLDGRAHPSRPALRHPAEAVKITARLTGDPAFYADHSDYARASTESLAPAVIAARYLEAVA